MEKVKKLILLLFVLSVLNLQANDTTYVKQIVDTSLIVKQNIKLKEQNKSLKGRNIASSIFAGIGFVTTITIIAIYTRP
jgi:hypothetical protein